MRFGAAYNMLKSASLKRFCSTLPSLISSAELRTALRQPQPPLCLDASWHMPTSGREARREFEDAHLPGARFWDIGAISDQRSDLPHMMTDAATLHDVLERFGVTNHTNIVVYDNAGMMSSFVVWYTLSVHGIERVSVLDGGLAAWKALGYELEQGAAERADGEGGGRLAPLKRCEERLRTLEQMKANLHKAEPTQVLDARSAERFHGRVPEPRPGLRSGHIPGSTNVPWTSLVRVQQGIPSFKENAELRQQFIESGVQLGPKQNYIVSCGSGVTAAVLAFALFRLGTPLGNISLYDGSWSEWGQEALGTPIETD